MKRITLTAPRPLGRVTQLRLTDVNLVRGSSRRATRGADSPSRWVAYMHRRGPMGLDPRRGDRQRFEFWGDIPFDELWCSVDNVREVTGGVELLPEDARQELLAFVRTATINFRLA